jgi:3-hydroxyisobutyrate dehydrogenase-like beta-hydroxyacid dehydrogenase
VVGLLYPGEMGTAVGQCLTERGYRVLWASKGRSPATEARARAAGLADASTPRELAAQSSVIISVCPPHAALDVAWAVHGFTGVYLDANAISPGTAREVARLIEGNGGRYVDGGIIGPPPRRAGTTRLYLSGADAQAVSARWRRSLNRWPRRACRMASIRPPSRSSADPRGCLTPPATRI